MNPNENPYSGAQSPGQPASTVDAATLEGASLSKDGTFFNNSDDFIPTEKATKTYVDDSIQQLVVDLGVSPEKVFTVSPSGGDYVSPQSALSANPTEGILVIVYPGTYVGTLNYTANNQNVVGISSAAQNIVTQSNSTICDYGAYTGCKLINIKMLLSAPVTAIPILTGSGSINLRFCDLTLTCSAAIAGIDQPSAINGTGDLKMKFGGINYSHTGVTGTGVKVPILLGTGATVDIERVSMNISGANTAAATGIMYGVSTGVMEARRCMIEVQDNDSTFVLGIYDNATSGESKYYNNDLHVVGNGNIAYGAYLNGSASVRSMYNHIHVEATGGAYSSFVNATSSLISSQDDVIAADGYAGAGSRVINSIINGINVIADGSSLMTSAAPTIDSQIANKKYVDDAAGRILGKSIIELSVYEAITASFPWFCLSLPSQTLTTANYSTAFVDEMRSRKLIYDEMNTAVSSFSGSWVSTTFTLDNNAANIAMITALSEDYLLAGTFTGFRILNDGTSDFEISAIDATARTITVSSGSPSGVAISIYLYRVFGSTTSIRHHSEAGLAVYQSDSDSKINGLRRLDAMQRLTGQRFGNLDNQGDYAVNGVFSDSILSAATFVMSAGANAWNGNTVDFDSANSISPNTARTTENETIAKSSASYRYLFVGSYAA